MSSRQIVAGIAALLLPLVGAQAAHAQTPAEQAELDAAANPQPGSPPLGDGTGIVCPPGTAPVDFYFSDLEADDGGWTGGGAAPWEWGAPVLGVFEGCDTVPEDEPAGAFSGVNVWATNLNGCHANSGSASLLSQTFDFSALPAPIQLSWWNWYEVFVPFDMAELIVNGGAPLFEVTTTAPTGVYIQESVDLSAFAGNPSVAIDFRLFATTVVNRAGWYLDDIQIQYCGGDDEADVEIEKVADTSQPLPGDTVIYTLTVTNNGPGTANGVSVTDTLPAGLSYVSDDCGGMFVDPNFTWNVGSLGNGVSATCNVTVSVDADAQGVLVNGATVTADNSDPDTTNNADSATIVVGGPGPLEIPTVGTVGLVVLVLLMAAAATLVLSRRRRDGRPLA